MALSPIAFIAPNYRDFKNYWLKAYEPSTTTPKTMALDSAGVVTVAKLELNADGFLVSAGAALVIPYIDGFYDAWLFPTEAEADANDTINAERVADNIIGVNGEVIADAIVIRFNTLGDALSESNPTLMFDGAALNIKERTTGNGGGAMWDVVLASSVTTNTFNIVQGVGVATLALVLRVDGVANISQFGAIGDGLTDNTAAIQATIDYAQSFTSENVKVVHIPVGRYVVRDTTGLLAAQNKSFYMSGDGYSSSVILFDNFFEPAGSGTQCLFTGNSADGSGTCSLMNFAIEGKWGQEADFSEQQGTVRLNGYDNFYVSGFKLTGSRSGGLVSSNSDNIVVVESIFEDCYRDSCRFENAINANISNNHFKNIQDDSIALPTSTSVANPVDNSYIIQGNTLVDSQGIIAQGAKTINISNNTIVRPIHRAIRVGQGANFNEGLTSAFDVIIANNNIRDGFSGTVFSPNSGASFTAIGINCETLLAKDTVESGDPVVTPYPYLYINDNDNPVLVNAGMFNIKIHGNNITRTLAPTANYSDYGFGERLSRSGFVDPTIILSDMMNRGIFFNGGGNGTDIQGNTIDGANNCIECDCFDAPNGVSIRNYTIKNNTLKNFVDSGMFLNFSGLMEIKGNTFDGDPYHEATQRNADGGWNSNYSEHRGIIFENPAGVANGDISGNTFKNVGIPFWQQGANVGSISTSNNKFICEPSDIGYNASNKGIGYIYQPALFDAKLIIEDSDPSSPTFKEITFVAQSGSVLQPVTGFYLRSMFVYDASGGGTLGWKRRTSGSAHVTGVDWQAIN